MVSTAANFVCKKADGTTANFSLPMSGSSFALQESLLRSVMQSAAEGGKLKIDITTSNGALSTFALHQ